MRSLDKAAVPGTSRFLFGFGTHSRESPRVPEPLPSVEEPFSVTKSRFLFNEAQQRAIRHREFNADALKQIACDAVGAQSCRAFRKLAEGAFNNIFLLELDNGTEVIARIPTPLAVPARLVTASEVATMDFLRTVLDIPVPKVLAYSADAETTPVGAEFIIMEKVQGSSLFDRISAVDRWPQVPEILPLADEVMTYEGKLLQARFAAFGSIYYTQDVAPELQAKPLYHPDSAVKAGADRFRIGPSVAVDFWRGERSNLDIDRGPWTNAQDYAAAVLECEREYVIRCAESSSPGTLHRPRGSRNAHIEALNGALAAVRSQLISDSAEFAPILWHPDLHAGNLMVPDADAPEPYRLHSIIDCQHACITPACLAIDIPPAFQYPGGIVQLPRLVPNVWAPATYPEGAKLLPREEKDRAKSDFDRANLHVVYYFKTTRGSALRASVALLPQRDLLVDILQSAARCWAEKLPELRLSLVHVQTSWAGWYPGVKCPVHIDDATMSQWLDDYEAYSKYQEARVALAHELDADPDGNVDAKDYEAAKTRCAEREREWNAKEIGGPFPFADGMLSISLS